MAGEGWIKIHRSLLENDIYNRGKFSYGQAWIDLLLHANHKPASVMLKCKSYNLEPGQLAWSQKSLAKRWKWSRHAVQTFLSVLKSEHQIEHHSDENTTIITVLNWDGYQNGGTKGDTSGAPEGHQKGTDKNDKNVKNEKKKDLVRPTEEECRIYFEELKGTNTDASEYFDFYSAKGWRVGSQPMKDWRAAARNWIRRKSEFGRRSDDWEEKFLGKA